MNHDLNPARNRTHASAPRATLGRTRPSRLPQFLLLWVFAAGLASAFAAVPESASAEPAFRWREFLAPFHSVVLHYPIGFVTLAVLLEWIYLRRPNPELGRIIGVVLFLSVLTAVLAGTFGLLRAGDGGYETRTLNLHRNYGIAVTLLVILCWRLERRFNRPDNPRPSRALYRLCLLSSLVILVIAGHHGGNLTHGSDYLTKNAPPVVKKILLRAAERNQPEIVLAADPSGRSPSETHFINEIQPIFTAKCLKCHGPEKHKGDYRIDLKESAFKGGDSGLVAIVPGEPMKSYLVELILLAPDHDEIMPPEGKNPLTPEEMVKIVHWINAGAAFVDSPQDTHAPQP